MSMGRFYNAYSPVHTDENGTCTWSFVVQVTVFKNLTNIVIVTGDWWFFNQTASILVMSSMAVMVFGAIVASYHDLHFK